MNLNCLTEREKDILLGHFFHYLPQSADARAGWNNRHHIAKEYPGIYNRLCGQSVVVAEFHHERDQVILAAFNRGRNNEG